MNQFNTSVESEQLIPQTNEFHHGTGVLIKGERSTCNAQEITTIDTYRKLQHDHLSHHNYSYFE